MTIDLVAGGHEQVPGRGVGVVKRLAPIDRRADFGPGYLITCSEPVPAPVMTVALTAATEHRIELLQLTGPALTSNVPATFVFQHLTSVTTR
jgi:hypothetical protein